MNTRLVQPYVKPEPKATPLNIPAWLANPEAIGPCPCGRPLGMNQPYTILQGDLFKQAYHIPCAQKKMYESGEWDPYEDPWDDDED